MNDPEKNIYATALKILGGIIVIFGIIGSVILGDVFKIEYGVTYTFREYNYYLMTVGILSSVITGALIMGMGELIQLAYKTSLDTRYILLLVKDKEKKGSNAEDEELPEL